VVTPNLDAATGSSSLRTGPGRKANVAIQDICPLDPSEHLQIGTTDAVAFALVDDALTHAGPADPVRIDRAVCAQPFQPGVDGSTVATDSAASFTALGNAFVRAPSVREEPALRCYVTASCPAGASAGASGGGSGATSRMCASRRRFTVHLERSVRMRGLRVTLDGRRLKVRRSRAGRRAVVVDLRGAKRTTATLRIVGRDARGRAVVRTHRYRTCTRRA